MISNGPITQSTGCVGLSDISKLVKGAAFARAVEKIPESYWQLSDEELQALARPTNTDHALRVSFWHSVALRGEGPIDASDIYSPICTYTHWHVGVLNNVRKLAWLLRPVKRYEELLEPLLQKAAERYQEIISIDFNDESGRPVPELVRVVWEAIKALELKTRGA